MTLNELITRLEKMRNAIGFDVDVMVVNESRTAYVEPVIKERARIDRMGDPFVTLDPVKAQQ